ncbi:MAG TPA: 30S ribosomal protein S16 [Candidatus Dormibacteraeota bacterium]|nr:30S ribosomal protein S16 [Candidatus Dormibacteraeota bacterium]
MLAIRMQRTGRRGHAMFRVVVQDARRTPTSGKVVTRLGSYDPHGKAVILDKEKAAFYLEHGAQPSDSVARLLKKEGVKLPAWVKLSADKERAVRNPDKRRSTRPDEPEAPAELEPEAIAEETPAEPAVDTTPAEASENTEVPAEEPAAEEKPAEEATE